MTINAFGLNRLTLVQERTRVIRRLEFLRDLVLELDEVVGGLAQPATVAALRGTPVDEPDDLNLALPTDEVDRCIEALTGPQITPDYHVRAERADGLGVDLHGGGVDPQPGSRR